MKPDYCSSKLNQFTDVFSSQSMMQSLLILLTDLRGRQYD